MALSLSKTNTDEYLSANGSGLFADEIEHRLNKNHDGQIRLLVSSLYIFISSVSLCVLTIALIQHFSSEQFSVILLGKGSETYPLTFQNFMWFPFSVGVCLAMARVRNYFLNQADLKNTAYMLKAELFTDAEAISKTKYMLLNYYEKHPYSYIPKLLGEGVGAMIESSRYQDIKEEIEINADHLYSELDAQYSNLKYISWLLPTLGFMGTVYGISDAVMLFGRVVGDPTEILPQIAGSLGLAFNTTLLALLQSAIIIFIFTYVEGLESKLISKSNLLCQSQCRRLMRQLNGRLDKIRKVS